MAALLTEIGLLGAEARTAGPLIAKSCPVSLPVQCPRKLWVRTLLAGYDTAVIFVVNDDIACDRSGITIKPVEKARISLPLPRWMEVHDAFEISYAGTQNINWQTVNEGLSIDIGKVELTRLIVITSNNKLRDQLQEKYNLLFKSKVNELLATKKELQKEAR
jgi:hypothetical protein